MKQFLYFFVVLFMASCTSNTIYKEPENLIPKDSMMTLLTDMYIASSSKNVKNKFLKKEKDYMLLVYEKYKIDSARFIISNTYYTSKPEEYNEMLLEVKKRLTAQNLELEKLINERDSIKRAQKPKKQTKLLEKSEGLKLPKDKIKKPKKR